MRLLTVVALLLTVSASLQPAMRNARAGEPPAATPQPEAKTAGLDYNRDIRPILSNNCFKCHGPDAAERKGGVRLDERDAALKPAESGELPIVAGKPDASALVSRIFAEDEAERMPPADSGKKLTDAQRALLKRWIAEGAPYQRHWAFIPPQRSALPKVAHADWPRNAIDYFILARLEREGLQPSREADKATLIRRLSLDLTGLPPTLAEVDAFLLDSRADAYERVVDRLLASPHYGERMALDWLDAARYADTNGYHIDNGRDMTRWREWVIDAYNRNLPFDRFTIQQLAGDLLPEADDPQETLRHRLASGFNRNHMINFEGGAIPQEYHNAYIVDRVNTTATVWLGLTVACGQCHDHKYDPITQKEYYQLYAFFYNVPENGLDGRTGNSPPLLKQPTEEQQRKLDELAAAIRGIEARAAGPIPEADAARRVHLAKLRKQRDELDGQVPSTMVMREMDKPRDTFVLVRGQYDKQGEKVTPGVPASLPPLPPGAPANRLGLARWLVDPAHPLTARVAVNRYWQMFFGTGLVKTAEDFGSQGEPPSHPELLDWLAVEFRAPSAAPDGSGSSTAWDTRAIVRLIVTSATYRQSSAVTPRLLAHDPENRLLARGPRMRLQAEFIRDQALAMSGLLNEKIGGASVSPYQPAGLWQELSYRDDGRNWTAQTYVQSHGPDLYRRTMYTFWKRSSPPPTLSTFDAPDRETCTVRRARTNTPLQALVLLNDPTYVEASRKLAERMMTEAGPTADERIALAFRLATARLPSANESAVLKKTFEDQWAFFRNDASAATKLLSTGEAPRNEKLDPAELAAWTTVASVILNLDETVTKG
jgi:mono/diheme cytochrome c family protein